MRPAAPGPDGGGQRRASGREKHTQKITVYLSAEELLDLERARLALLRYGAAADRGRIVREAIAVLLGDLDAKGEDSLLARRIASEDRASEIRASANGATANGATANLAVRIRAGDKGSGRRAGGADGLRRRLARRTLGSVPEQAPGLATVMKVSVDGTDVGPEDAPRAGGFQVRLDVFEGPFDLLLALISKHKLDITEVALSQVTDDFIAYISERSDSWDLDQVSYFLVVAATLLDLKAARLLPTGEVEDEEDLALLEARDLLFARLLQYRAYKEVAAIFAARMTAAARRFPRRVPLEPRFAQLLPEVLLGLGPAEFARLATLALAPKPPPEVDTGHIHAPLISIRDQAAFIATLLRELGRASFRRLTANAAGSYEIVASFLALLELYREDAVSFEQVAPLGELYVTWTGPVGTDSFTELTESDDDQ